MKMNEYLTALQTHLTTQQSTNQNLLDLLYDAYNDTTGMDNEEAVCSLSLSVVTITIT